VITLLVSPDDAEKLALASSEGKIQLALRNPLDTKAEDLPSTNARALYKGGPLPAPTTEPAVHKTVVKKSAPPIVTPQQPTSFSVEIYQGDKPKQTVELKEQDSDAK